MKKKNHTKKVRRLRTNDLTMLYFIAKQNQLDLCNVRQCDVAIEILNKSIKEN